jgi:Lrp/AsnC family transcriptional regulator for asnA, asnC and gidA
MSTKLDSIDSIILKELLIDGRQSFTRIAQKHNTTKEIIANHYKKLEKNGVIVGSTIQTSPICSGHQFVTDFFIVTQFQNINQLCTLVSKIPNIKAALPFGIRRTITAVATLKNAQEIEAIRAELKKLPLVEDLDVRIITSVRTMPHNLSVLSTESPCSVNPNQVKNYKNSETIDIDELDKKIVAKLLLNCRAPFYKIAQELQVSTDTIARRYQRLKNNGLIKPIIQINAKKIGYFAFAVFNLSVSENNMEEAIDFLTNTENVNLIEKTSGRFDIFSTLMIKDMEHFSAVQEQIVNLPGLTNAEVIVVEIFDVWPPAGELVSNF